MKHQSAHRLLVAAAMLVVACSSQPVVTTTSRTVSTSGGDVALGAPDGMWMDSVGGTWMDTSGGYWIGGRDGQPIDLQPGDVSSFTDANIVAHLSAGDSLEVSLSQLGVDRAQSSAVRDFARRMVTEHSEHMRMGKQMAMDGGITPMPSPADTADAGMAARAMNRLSNATSGTQFDRQFMRAEVMMHQHMLHELTMVRPQANGAALQLVDHTIPVVRQHLADAQTVWRQVGGSANDRGM